MLNRIAAARDRRVEIRFVPGKEIYLATRLCLKRRDVKNNEGKQIS